MIVFGYSGSAGSYDPRANRWVEISTVGAPSAYNSRAVWTGFGMFVVGTNYNASLLSAGLYDPQTDAWTPASTIDAPEPRSAFTMVWTGREAILWGGAKFPGALTTGGRYDPASDTWTATSIVDVPAPRSSHTAVWTGHEMVVWGGDPGYSYPYMLGNGGRYDPESDTWTATTDVDAPSPRKRHTSVWTGSEMIVWGGDSADVFFRPPAGGRYTVCSEGD
jgi:N-acetylneuraminic acid mutarotase